MSLFSFPHPPLYQPPFTPNFYWAAGGLNESAVDSFLAVHDWLSALSHGSPTVLIHQGLMSQVLLDISTCGPSDPMPTIWCGGGPDSVLRDLVGAIAGPFRTNTLN